VNRLAAVTLIAALTSACGSAHTLTRREYVRQMQQFHEAALRRAVRSWPGILCHRAIERREWLREARRALRASGAAIDRVSALHPPRDVASAHARYLAFLRDDHRFLRELYHDVAVGDASPGDASHRLSNPPRPLVRELGRATLAFARARVDVFGTTAFGWTGRPPKPHGC
jgi:hypothetical protein